METENQTSEKVLTALIKEPFSMHTVTSLANALGITRQGLWKTVNKLLVNKMITITQIGKTKKSTFTISLNWSNPLTEKTLSLLLTREALKQERWRVNFSELERNVGFLILFGSILNSPKEAGDIDLLAMVENPKNFGEIDKIILKIQITQIKKIHLIDLTEAEFAEELKKQNKAYLEALKKGTVLYGQENFIKFIRRIQAK